MQAKRTSALQIAADKRSIDNRHFVCGLEIACSESTPRKQRDAHRLKKTWSYRKHIPPDSIFLALKVGVAAPKTAAQENARRITHTAHFRKRTEPDLKFAVQVLRLLFAVLVL